MALPTPEREIMEGGSEEEEAEPFSWGPKEELPEWQHLERIHDLTDARLKKWTEEELQQASGLPDTVVKRCIKRLLEIEDIVEVEADSDNPNDETHYMSAVFAQEVSNPLNEILREHCVKIVNREKVVTLDEITYLLGTKSHKGMSARMPKQMVQDLLMAPLIDMNQVVEFQSNGVGEFAWLPVGKTCYVPPSSAPS